METGDVGAHLAARYGIEVSGSAELDTGVWRVDRADGPSWVARVFPAERPMGEVAGDAAVLTALAEAGFPAERTATAEPVSDWRGHGVLVTEFISGSRPERPGRVHAILGALLGRLHTRSGEQFRAGGAWHHAAVSGGPRAEIDGALAMLDAVPVPAGHQDAADRIRDQLLAADDGTGLPQAFTHPDFVTANAIVLPDETLAIVDWAGAGRGPRCHSLAWLLWASGHPRLIDLVISRYARHITPEPAELARLAAILRVRPLVIDCWSLRQGRLTLPEVADRMTAAADRAGTIAEQVRRAFPAPATVSREEAAGQRGLTELLSRALVAFTVEFDNEFEHRLPHRTTRHGGTTGPWLISLAMWANCLRWLPDEGSTVGELRRQARTGTNLDGMRRWGYLTLEPGTGKPRPDTVLRLTKAGRQARNTGHELLDEVERRWRERSDIDGLRAALLTAAGRSELPLPDCLPVLGHGLYSRVPELGPAVPPTPELPLPALLARVLLALAVEYERESTVSLAIGANVLRVLGEAVPVREVPRLTGLAKEAVGVALGHLERTGLASTDSGRGRLVRPTAAGQQARTADARLLDRIEQSRPGLDALTTALAPLPLHAGLTPYPDGWRAAAPEPLPRYPMVLHRGGYPDGS